MTEGERQREKERDRERKRETERDRERDRETERDRERQRQRNEQTVFYKTTIELICEIETRIDIHMYKCIINLHYVYSLT